MVRKKAGTLIIDLISSHSLNQHFLIHSSNNKPIQSVVMMSSVDMILLPLDVLMLAGQPYRVIWNLRELLTSPYQVCIVYYSVLLVPPSNIYAHSHVCTCAYMYAYTHSS